MGRGDDRLEGANSPPPRESSDGTDAAGRHDASKGERDRHRERDGSRRHRERDDRDRDRDRHREHRHSGRDEGHRRSRGEREHRSHSRHRSRSRSRSRDGRRRDSKRSGFDLAPPGVSLPPLPMPGIQTAVAVPSSQTQHLGMPSMPNMPNMGMPGMSGMATMFPAMFPFMNTQATRHARRVYVGGLPPMANEQVIATFFSQAMAAIGGNTAGPGDAVVNVYINQEKKFAFVEMRTVEEASNAIALDGVMFEGVAVRCRRPSDYNPAMAAALGPSQPSPHLNLAAVGLTPGAAGGADGPDRIFVGGLPYYLTEEQIKELLSSFGPLRGFDLVKDRDTGNSKGYGFAVYQDTSVTDIACMALNGMKMGDKTLTVRRATASSGQPKPDQANVLAQAQQQIALQKLALVTAAGPGMLVSAGINIPGLTPPPESEEEPTKVVCLTQVVSPSELVADEDYEEIMEDMREECGKHGTLENLVIPRPTASGDAPPGVGKVFVEFSDTDGARKAKTSLHGRKFGGNAVIALYYPEEKFARADYSG